MATTMATAVAVAKMMVADDDNNHHCGGGRGRGDKNDAGEGGSGPMTRFVLERTDCRVSSLSLGVGWMPTPEVLLHTSSIVALSSESAAPATTPGPLITAFNLLPRMLTVRSWQGRGKGYGEMTRPFVHQCGWGSRLSWHPPPPGQAVRCGSRRVYRWWLWYQ